MGQAETADRARRMAGAPISWGVCEVPGWGLQLAPERVLREMAELGLKATELGPQGGCRSTAPPCAPCSTATACGSSAASCPSSCTSPSSTAHANAPPAAEQLAAAGADVFVAALVQDDDGRTPVPLDDDGWRRAGEHLASSPTLVAGRGLTLGCTPTSARSIETAHDVERRSRTPTCPGAWTPGTC